MKIANLGKAGFLGLLLVFNTSILNAADSLEEAWAEIVATLQYSCEHSSDSQDNDETDATTTNTQAQVNDNTTNIITNTTNSGNCTPTYNHITHSYDCI